MKPQNIPVLDKPAYRKPCALAIGMFDGLHRGHRRVLETCIKLSKETGAEAAVLTFDPHPSAVVKMPHPPAEMLFCPYARAKMFECAGVGKVFVKNFDKNFAAMTPEKFAKFLAAVFPKLTAIITGENFLFGKGASGNTESLKKICAERGWKYKAVKRLKSGGARISSTRLRDELRKGAMSEYKRLAGRPYEAFGKVEGGRKLGRKIGFPTLNIPWNPACKPPYGAYAVEAVDECGHSFSAIASYGTSPTVGGGKPLIETNILGETHLKTGSNISVRFLKFLRPQKKFASLEELRTAIEADKAAAQKFFKRRETKKPPKTRRGKKIKSDKNK